MATTHHFSNDEDYTPGGRWVDDYGRTICRWSWNADTREIDVVCGHRGRTQDLSGFDKDWLTDDALRERLPRLALEVAQTLR